MLSSKILAFNNFNINFKKAFTADEKINKTNCIFEF